MKVVRIIPEEYSAVMTSTPSTPMASWLRNIALKANPIEPARFAVPVLTGPNVRNFAAVYRTFVEAGAARFVHSEAELTQALANWLADPAGARKAGEAGRRLLAENAGATGRIADALEQFLA